MLNTLEQLDLENLLLGLHDVNSSVSKFVWEGVIDLGA